MLTTATSFEWLWLVITDGGDNCMQSMAKQFQSKKDFDCKTLNSNSNISECGPTSINMVMNLQVVSQQQLHTRKMTKLELRRVNLPYMY